MEKLRNRTDLSIWAAYFFFFCNILKFFTRSITYFSATLVAMLFLVKKKKNRTQDSDIKCEMTASQRNQRSKHLNLMLDLSERYIDRQTNIRMRAAATSLAASSNSGLLSSALPPQDQADSATYINPNYGRKISRASFLSSRLSKGHYGLIRLSFNGRFSCPVFVLNFGSRWMGSGVSTEVEFTPHKQVIKGSIIESPVFSIGLSQR